jgi:signal transduction histidine kinase
VGLLRQPEDEPAPRQPTTGLAGLPDLLDSFRRAGLDIACHGDADDRHLPWAVDHTAYRIVQEALTNVRRHAGPVTVALTVRHDPETVTVIVDNGGPVAAAGDGHGITGMRERVAALGGTLVAGPRPDGGFRVAAVLPVMA